MINKDFIYLINNLLITANLRKNLKLIFKFNKYCIGYGFFLEYFV